MPTQHYPVLLGHIGVAFSMYLMRFISYLVMAYIALQLAKYGLDLPKVLALLEPHNFWRLIAAHISLTIIGGLIFAQFAKRGAVTLSGNSLTGRDLQLRRQTIQLDQLTELAPHKSFGVDYLLVNSGDTQIAIYRQSVGFNELAQRLQQQCVTTEIENAA